MAVAVAKTFSQSVRMLPPQVTHKAWEFMERFHEDPTGAGFRFERVRAARSKNIWSARLDQSHRVIVYHMGDTRVLLYADKHDAAYRWAENKDLRRHETTGALQVVDVQERVEHVTRRVEIEPGPDLFSDYSEMFLIRLGLPTTALPLIRHCYSESDLLEIVADLPEEVGERLLQLYDGQEVEPPPIIAENEDPLQHPDSQRRFYVVRDADDLRLALNAPLEEWLVFLHPEQRSVVEADYSGPAKVSGRAGTGKTVVAMHRARRLVQALSEDALPVLLTAFSRTLAQHTDDTLELLCNEKEKSRINVDTVHGVAMQLTAQAGLKADMMNDDDMRDLIAGACAEVGASLSASFLHREWRDVIQAQRIQSRDEYYLARRHGRGTPLYRKNRAEAWRVFSLVRNHMKSEGLWDWDELCWQAAELVESGEIRQPYSRVVVDEVQDLHPSGMALIRAIGGTGPNGIFLVGDAGQSIFPGGYSLNQLGLEVRGRSTVLRINYRTTEQIRRFADDLARVTEGEEEDRAAVSLLSGPEPTMLAAQTPEDEVLQIGSAIEELLGQDIPLHEMALFARTNSLLDERYLPYLRELDIEVHRLTNQDGRSAKGFHIGTMHRAKGLEFRVVFVSGLEEGRVPVSRSDDLSQAGLGRHLEQERRLLYVAMTRARDELYLSWGRHPSSFLTEINHSGKGASS